ncbi:MAG: outer membrane beta-barrel protein [Flavobacteriales bacterium]|nr:outer membrane beta-barrel protein [Flavobacteriales bacterium]
MNSNTLKKVRQIILMMMMVMFTGHQTKAQDSTKFFLGNYVFPNTCNMLYKNKGGVSVDQESFIRNQEFEKKSLSGGIMAEYHLNQRLALRLGLGFRSTGYRIRPLIYINTDTITGLKDTIKTGEKHTFYYAEIPLDFVVRFGKHWYAAAGVTGLYNFCHYKYYYNKRFDNGIPELETRKKNVAAQVAIGYRMAYKDRIMIDIQPGAQCMIRSLYVNDPMNRRMVVAGLTIGLMVPQKKHKRWKEPVEQVIIEKQL